MGKGLVAILLAALMPAGAPLDRAQADLAGLRQQVSAAIAADENLDAEERREWAAKLDASVTGWLRFRDAHCDAGLMAFEQRASPQVCALGITRTILSDLQFRYQLRDGAMPRADAVMAMAQLPPPSEDDTRGPCGKVDPGECDYCGANRCWEARLAADDRALNAIWRGVLIMIDRARLSPEKRADWAERMRASQRAWLAWRDMTCNVETWETPNRFARSIYSGLLAPCIDGETRARVTYLRRMYRLR
jgi:uncharacterized protein YecT (DUF1311 family)